MQNDAGLSFAKCENVPFGFAHTGASWSLPDDESEGTAFIGAEQIGGIDSKTGRDDTRIETNAPFAVGTLKPAQKPGTIA